jgi:hypothetical protein
MADVVSGWPREVTTECALIVVCAGHSLVAVGSKEPRHLWTVGSDHPHGRLAFHQGRLTMEPPGVWRAGWSLTDGLRVACPHHSSSGHLVDVAKMLAQLDKLGTAPRSNPHRVGVSAVLHDPVP